MQEKSNYVTRLLHWLSAVLIIGLLISGIYMAEGYDYSLYDWHKAFGVIALLLVLNRLFYRRRNPWRSSAKGTQHEKTVELMHQCLLSLCLLMPVSGLVYSGLGGYGVSVFGFTIIADAYTQTGEVIAYSQSGSDSGKAMHFYMGYLMAVLVMLHGLAALKHHFIDKDFTLTRMLIGTKKSALKNNNEV